MMMKMTMLTTSIDINPDDLIKHHCFLFGDVLMILMND